MELINLQPTEKVVHRVDGTLEVVSIWPTIQGEGPFAGTPAVFVRLAGCVHQCTLCDTQYTAGRQLLFVKEIVGRIKSAGNFSFKPLVVITGGEPFRQRLCNLVDVLVMANYQVQIETSGSLYQPLNYKDLTIVCSPKTTNVHENLRPHVSAYKYVVESGKVDPSDGLPTWVLGDECRVYRPGGTLRSSGFLADEIYVQPCDEQDPVKNKANMDQAVKSCMEFGYRLCLQMHKIVGLD